jgi:hypothetical protein
MLYPMQARLNLAKIANGGADLKDRKNAHALEFPRDSKKLEFEMQKNRDMIKRSEGLLAPIQGTERFLTLGTGHTTAGIRGSLYKCKVGVPSIMGTDGKLGLTMQRAKDPALELMHVSGWDFKIISDEAVQT